ncbi:MAG: phage tail sheath subtilisin-like domain-containing protein [Desulfuromonadaceae bacterium]|nr:phage tail sheath subtilisin-like domain-containing protein [Desulfuromonadaceae bacterium]
MPEYLAPGVYVEETSFRSKSIEGVSTTTTGFVGPTRYGPIGIEPEIVTSLAEFERMYGDRSQLKFTDESGIPLAPMHNYMWHGVRAFFEEGGKRLYISRIFRDISTSDDGCADVHLPESPSETEASIRIRARFPGELGSMRVRLTLRLGQNILGQEPIPGQPTKFTTSVNSLVEGDVVWISDIPGSPPTSASGESGDYYIARKYTDSITNKISWNFENEYASGGITSPPSSRTLDSLVYNVDPTRSDKVRILTLTVSVIPTGKSDFAPAVYEGLALHPGHKRGSEGDSLFDRFAAEPANISLARRLPIVVTAFHITDGIEFLKLLFNHTSSSTSTLRSALDKFDSTDMERSIDLLLTGGNDGQRPGAAEYEGTIDPNTNKRTGLKVFEDLEDISIVAAPGATFGYAKNTADAASTVNALISHATRMRYRIAVLDSGDGQSIAEVRDMRAKLDSSYAALYYPWVRVLDPVTRAEINLPPSGFVAGIYARNDTNRAVYKAPANEVVNLAIGFETLINKSQQEVLNPEGINCFRYFEGRGFRLWGARTVSSDPEWKYVNLRRYFAYLEHSIDKGTQWAVFEPNGEMLWANVRRTIEDFMLNEWQSGALLGDKPDKAFFVRCDRSTMTQNDLDNGRLICLVGLAPLRPAEFVIFRIGQWTADRKN